MRPPATRVEAEPEEVTMADQTTSSIVIDAPPSAVMDVIADFPSYPTWAKGVSTAEVVSEFADGRAEKVFFKLDVSPIKDEYTLVYVWSGDEQVTWELDKGEKLLIDTALKGLKKRVESLA